MIVFLLPSLGVPFSAPGPLKKSILIRGLSVDGHLSRNNNKTEASHVALLKSGTKIIGAPKQEWTRTKLNLVGRELP
jgi:hypothetical protein